MDIKVQGGQVLSGEIFPSGSKNSAVHILPSTLLFRAKVVLENIPDISDVYKLISILEKLGSKISWNKDKKEMSIDNTHVTFSKLTSEDVGNMKGSALVWGGLLGRFKKVDMRDLPGGCTLGIRPIEPFLKAFRDLGILVTESSKGIVMDAKNAGSRNIWMTEQAVSVTSTLVMIAVTLKGTTRITGAACEPQIQDLCNFLNKAGAKIIGVGSNILEIHGGKTLTSVRYRILSDHNEVTTFLALGAATGGRIKVHDVDPSLYSQIAYEFSKFNINIVFKDNAAIVEAKQHIKFTGSFKKKTNIVRAQPWPGFPVDLLPMMIPLALIAPDGYMIFHNWMYEAGLFWTSELIKLGAEVIMCDPHRVVVVGGKKLVGGTLEAPYIIRAVVALVIAGMVADGETLILDADALYRGHPYFAENLKKLGAKIEVLTETKR
ncbi:UDP-N-acetylglucosamine 1-carboxyvinyltransferase [Candidatus Woesebacteria bacterium]|nr:MAG: UDP-N-acetylglucosamine 1-carboxyvinyltransferase [Candidatus Woesebacteria bacterium]